MKNVINLVATLQKVEDFNENEITNILLSQEWIRHSNPGSTGEEWKKGGFSVHVGFDTQEFPVSILSWSAIPSTTGRGDLGLDPLYDKARSVTEELKLSIQQIFQKRDNIEYSTESFSDLDYFEQHSWRTDSHTIHLGAIQYDTDLPVIVEIYVK